MDLQNKIIALIGIDKILHFSVAGWVSSYGPEWWMRILIAFILGILKELIDKFLRGSEFDWKDVMWTTLGGVVSATLP